MPIVFPSRRIPSRTYAYLMRAYAIHTDSACKITLIRHQSGSG